MHNMQFSCAVQAMLAAAALIAAAWLGKYVGFLVLSIAKETS